MHNHDLLADLDQGEMREHKDHANRDQSRDSLDCGLHSNKAPGGIRSRSASHTRQRDTSASNAKAPTIATITIQPFAAPVSELR
jgi:hypothetical protein